MSRFELAACWLAAAVFAAGCGPTLERDTAPSSGEDARTGLSGDSIPAASRLTGRTLEADLEDGRVDLRPGIRFRQVGLTFDGRAPLEFRARRPAGGWTAWRTVETTWREGPAAVGRILLKTPADHLQLRTSGHPDALYAEFYPRHRVLRSSRSPSEPPDEKRARPASPTPPDTGRTSAALSPDGKIVSRADWGARHPNKKCGRRHDPYRMTVHHTAVPADDGGNAARRMRQMQAFHIDNRGWCDIGYHFVVSKSGKIFRGRKTEQRTGAHVGGENHGNVGTALIGNFDRQKLKPQQRRPATWVLGWLHEKHDIALDPGHLKGHTQWPNQATSCPGDRVLSRLTSLRNRADRRADSDDRLKIAVTSTVVGAPDRYTQGSSDGVIDPLPGQTVRARLTVENNTGRALSDVRLGYSLASPHLDAADYRIEASPKEKSSWSRDEASRASENPDPSAIGKKGAFHLKTLRPGEAKRAVVALKASRFSLGQTDHPGVRAWLWRAGKAYGDQSGWSDRPQTGERGPNKRARSEIDVPSRDHWAFEETSGPQHLEGWTACCGDDWDRVALNTKAGALALHATGSDARLRAPDWTRLDADRWDQLVLKLRSHDGPHRAAVYWAGPDEQLAESRSVEFRAPGDGDFHTLVVPLGRLEQWAGTVAKLRIDPLDDRAPADGATAWYDLAHAYFQDSTDRVTTAAQQSFRSHAPVDLLDAPAGSDPPPGVGGTDPRGGGRSRTVVANTPPAGDVEVNSAGCSSVDPVQSPSRWPLVALVVVLGAARFRRRE